MERKNEIKITKKDLLSNNQQTIKNIDNAILDFFTKTLKLYVIENNKKVIVPVILFTPERWKQLKDQKNLRDNKKQIILPIITIKRNTINFLPEQYYLPNKHNFVTIMEGIPKENKYQNYSKRKDNSITNKYIVQVEPPTPIEIEYEIRMQARYIESMTYLIEQLVMNKNKGRIVSTDGFNIKWEIDGFSDESNLDDFSEEIRVITNSFSFTVESQIYNKYKNNGMNIIKKFTPHKIILTEIED